MTKGQGGSSVDVDTVIDRPGAKVTGEAPEMPPEPPVDADATTTGSQSARARAATLTVGPATVPATGLEITDVIGVGGMGVVYRARQLGLGRQIAFKRLIEEPTEEMRARFVREARLTAQLDHPNIVPVHLLDPGSEETPSGYAMKLVEGKTLANVIAEAREQRRLGETLDDEHALETRIEHFLKVCDAIAFAHDRRIIHRDLKPANVMIAAFGAVYVMDWGIARPIGGDGSGAGDSAARTATDDGDAELTRVGSRIGSPQYMSPEQAQGKNAELDARSDQYALGLLLHELVALTPAISSGSASAALKAAERGERAPLDAVDDGAGKAPRELTAIVARATALEPEARYPSVHALADDVRRYQRGDAVRALPEGPLAQVLRFMSRHRRATLGVLIAVIVVAAFTVSWTRYRQAANELATREHGAKLTALYGEVARQAHVIDTELHQLEEALEGLATAAEWALIGPEPANPNAPIYFDVDFADSARRPADFTDKTAYRWPVSFDHLVVGMAPGTDRAALTPRIRRLLPLRDHMAQMVVAAAVGDTKVVQPEDARALVLGRKSPIDYAYIDLPEGVHMQWPGFAALPPGYDVRTAGFYQISANQHGKRWGAPYIDSTTDSAGDDLVLPCTEGLWSPTGEFLGVAGVEITVTKMVETSMIMANRTTLRASLVDARGRKVIDSRDAGKRFVASGKDEALQYAEFDLPEIAGAIRTGAPGLRELVRDGRQIVVAFVRLDTLGWYYVVEVDATTLGAR